MPTTTATEDGIMKSPLLELPPELRNRIYSDVLVQATTVHVTTTTAKPNWNVPSLLHTCRQIRSEASGIYYSSNTFRFASFNDPNSPDDSSEADGATDLVDASETDDDSDADSDAEEFDEYDMKMNCWGVFKRWLRALGPLNRAMLRKIDLDDQYHPSEEWVKEVIGWWRDCLSEHGLDIDRAVLFVELEGHDGAEDGAQWYATTADGAIYEPGSKRGEDGRALD